MPGELFRPSEVQALVDAGAQLVDVLPREEYEELHLPGAIGVPLPKIDAEARDKLDPARPVVVYCWDSAWDLSPRAAARLESLGFRQVYDYVPGKIDWMARGHPTEGRDAGKPTAGSLARHDIATCLLDDTVRDARGRAAAGGICVVVNEGRIVLGVLRSTEFEADDDTRVADVMRPGPSTFRPHVPAGEMVEYMTKHNLENALVTSAEGRLLGVLSRDAAVHAAHNPS